MGPGTFPVASGGTDSGDRGRDDNGGGTDVTPPGPPSPLTPSVPSTPLAPFRGPTTGAGSFGKGVVSGGPSGEEVNGRATGGGATTVFSADGPGGTDDTGGGTDRFRGPSPPAVSTLSTVRGGSLRSADATGGAKNLLFSHSAPPPMADSAYIPNTPLVPEPTKVSHLNSHFPSKRPVTSTSARLSLTAETTKTAGTS